MPCRANNVGPSGMHASLFEAERAAEPPARRRRETKLRRKGNRDDVAAQRSTRSELGTQKVSRRSGKIAKQGIDLEHPFSGAPRPEFDNVEITQKYIDLQALVPELGTAVHEPSPRAWRVYVTASFQGRKPDCAAIADAEIPVTARKVRPERA